VLGHVLGYARQMRLIGATFYVQGPDGTWAHYAKTCLVHPSSCPSVAGVGYKIGPEVENLAAETRPNNALEILSVASNLHKTPEPEARRCTSAPSATPTSTRR
jgi:hypothetical protein